MRFRPDRAIAESTAWMPWTSGNGEIGNSSLMQKWPPIEVTAAASQPAAFSRAISPAKTAACLAGARSFRLRDISRTSAWAIVHCSGTPAAAWRSISPR